VLGEGDDAIICTDEELVILINEKLPEDDQITQRTFESWKSLAQSSQDLDLNLVEFHRVIKKALIREKKSLYSQLRNDDKAWQRWAWIIERKFGEWNIKRKVDASLNAKNDGAALLAGSLLEDEKGESNEG
jgi:hypothetical protein